MMLNDELPALNETSKGSSPGQGLREADTLPNQSSSKVSIRIRRYRPSDREIFRRLCCDSGFLGQPVDALFQDRELFADLFTRPYTDYEPERILVAEDHERVIGYLFGSVRKHFDLILMRSGMRTVAKMLSRLAGGRYANHPRSRRFIRWLLLSARREQPKHPADAAHLHIQIANDHRGRGVGRRLWERYEQELLALGIKRCYGIFYSHRHRRPELAYARYGFTVYDRRRTTMFEPEISEPVEVVCVCKEF